MAQSANRRAVRWLRAQLPVLTRNGTISPDVAVAIESYYETTESRAPNFGFVVLATLGTGLISAGMILLLAHNWDELSRDARTIIAFLPLIAAQALAAFVLIRRDGSRPWREGAAIFDVAAVAAAISLISQTYQIQGSFADFMRIWLLLSVPVVYLMRTTLGTVLYLAGAVVWLFARDEWFSSQQSPLFFWLLLLLIVPYFLLCFRRDSSSRETAWLAILLAIAAGIGLGFTADFTKANLGGVAFAGLSTAVYLCGMQFFPQNERRLHPLALVAGIGMGATAIVLSFESIWHLSEHLPWDQRSAAGKAGVAIELFFPAVAVGLAGWSIFRGQKKFSITAAALPLVAGIGWSVAQLCKLPLYQSTRCSFAAAGILDIYVLLFGIAALIRGIRAGSIARANLGLLVIAALAFARFFDTDLSFVTRGVGFIAVGLGFLVANIIFFRKRVVV